MDISGFRQKSDCEWELPRSGRMRAPAVVFASRELLAEMDEDAVAQLVNVACLPGIRKAAFAMPDAHWGYGFPIGGVAAFNPEDGVVSAGGVGFDIACGVRTLLTGLAAEELEGRLDKLADALFREVPAGVGSAGKLKLSERELDKVLLEGAEWAVSRGYGSREDLARIENGGRLDGADPGQVSKKAKQRQSPEMGTLGSGNHYLELQEVTDIYAPQTADIFGLRKGQVAVSIHCGSRGLGHQVATEFTRLMAQAAGRHGIALPDPQLACAPIDSKEGRAYFGAMASAANCAMANRQILAALVRGVFERTLGPCEMPLLYDVSHNLCRLEEHELDGTRTRLYVHRKGATRAFGPGMPDLPGAFRSCGQPAIIGGSMGTASFILAGAGNPNGFCSVSHGAGRRLSRRQAAKLRSGRQVAEQLERLNIRIRSDSFRGLAEEAPEAYKDINAVIDSAERAGLAVKVARLRPMACIKG